MGAAGTKYLMPHLWKEDEPDSQAPLKYDPEFGFSQPRKPRVPKVTEEEMDSVGLAMNERDECAGILVELWGCQKYNNPLTRKCNHLMHEYHHCKDMWQVNDFKEFEREKRLNRRERLIRLSENNKE